MDSKTLRELLDAVALGQTSVAQAQERLARLPFADLGFARVDHHRTLRTGFPEVVLCAGKRVEHLVPIVRELAATGGNILCTRASAEQAQAVQAAVPAARYEDLARLIIVEQKPVAVVGQGTIVVACAGTSDIAIAEEAALTATYLGSRVVRLYDVGVAGLHRTLSAYDTLRQAAVIVAVAGMEGALPSVIAGLSGRPVIAVPTSVGYGASLGGVAALLAMLSSCASGVTVVNIDNGFGAGYSAALINRGLSNELPAPQETPRKPRGQRRKSRGSHTI